MPRDESALKVLLKPEEEDENMGARKPKATKKKVCGQGHTQTRKYIRGW